MEGTTTAAGDVLLENGKDENFRTSSNRVLMHTNTFYIRQNAYLLNLEAVYRSPSKICWFERYYAVVSILPHTLWHQPLCR